MRRQDGEEGEENGGFFDPAEIAQAVKALIDLLVEEAAEPTRRRFFCCDGMEAERRSSRKWNVLRGKLKVRGIGCCGSSWSSAALDGDDMGVGEGGEQREAEARDVCIPHHHDTEMERRESIEEEAPRVEEQHQEDEEEPPRTEEEEDNDDDENQDSARRSRTEATENETTDPAAMRRREATMNLAAALAAERHLRAAQVCHQTESRQPPFRVSLMALLEQEHEGGNSNDINNMKKKRGSSRGAEEWPGAGCCCVCMSREKGAAFIPCGHTFCRGCSRELWLNRGSCPLCNRQILEILDIF